MIKLESIFADLQCVEYSLDKYCFQLPLNYKEIANYNFNFDFCISNINTTEEDVFIGDIIFYVIGTPGFDSSYEVINMELSGRFMGNPNYFDNEEEFKEMLNINGLVFLSQIARSHILSATSCIGLPEPILLPMLNIMELIKEKYQNE